MASTKQMQARAKAGRILKQAQNFRDQLFDRLDLIAEVCDMVPAGAMLVGNMYNDFKEEYQKMGDTFGGVHTFSDYLGDPTSNGRRAFVLMYNKRIAGFITLNKTVGNHVYVELVYVKPEFRGQDLSSLMYMWAQQEHGAEAVELSYRRIAGKEHYWVALGFMRFAPLPEQAGTKIALAMVCNDLKMGWPLQPEVLRKIRGACNTGAIKKMIIKEVA
jgi:GNAT superfamily N-acetyltransferase